MDKIKHTPGTEQDYQDGRITGSQYFGTNYANENVVEDGLRRTRTGVELIDDERKRQILQEGWTPEHDDEHDGNQMAMAAACYASPVPLRAQIEVPCGCREAMCPHSAFGKHMWVDAWPWEVSWDKRKKHDRIRQLAIAGALIAAEIDRLSRALEVKI